RTVCRSVNGPRHAGGGPPLGDHSMREIERRRVLGVNWIEAGQQRGVGEHRVIGDEDGYRHAGAVHLTSGFDYSLVATFREYYPALEISSALPDAIDKAHFANFLASASATAGWTRPLRLPWCLATSRTTLELM